MARPHAEINQTQFEKLCGMQCTQQEICDWFNVDDMTLNRWCKRVYNNSFSEIFRQKRGIGKVSLRRSQWQAAEKGNVTMLIWLGKQYLNQCEQPEPEGGNDNQREKDPLSIAFERYEDGNVQQ